MASSSSRGRSSSPFGYRKPSSPSPYSSTSSSSSLMNGRSMPRSCSSSASTFYGASNGYSSSKPISRGKSDSIYRSSRTQMSRAPIPFPSADELIAESVDPSRSGDSISVTIRFRPLSDREYQRGDEVAWYADGEKIVRSEFNAAAAYAFDRVFGPSTNSSTVYDVAARPVVKAAMEGVNGTVFAYGVTSSGKTHTMHGDQNSPGIIPLAIKDVFSIIQDTPGREFLLRVSYLEIYNEVINDLLDPTGQNLRVREDAQHADEEVERCYEEFYETEFLKFVEIVNFKVCRNGSFHLRGNVYVHYKSLESAMLAYHSINGRYFAGKQITCEYVGVTRWKVAICGEYMKSMFKTCSRGTACNFIHCFRNPGGDYEWADWDKPPPKYWMKKMDALFGPSDDVGYDRHQGSESRGQQRDSNKKITPKSDRYHSRRSRSRDGDYISSNFDEDNSDGNRSQQSRRSSRHKHLPSRRNTRSSHDDHDYSVGDRERHTRHSGSHSRHHSKWKDHYDHDNVENNYKGNDY